MFEIDSDASAIVKPSHRVHSALELLGVREMYPAEIIRHHILPCFQQEQWKVCKACFVIECIRVRTHVHVHVTPCSDNSLTQCKIDENLMGI